MTRDEVIERLLPHEAELRSSGLAALYLFGSTARNEAGQDSDVDFAFDLAQPSNVGLIEYFRLKDRMSDLLGTQIDLVSRRMLRPRIREHASRDMIQLF